MQPNRFRRHIAPWLVVFALAVPFTPPSIGAAAPAFSAGSPLGATLSVLASPVEVANADAGSSFAAAIDGQTLYKGDTVRTGPGGIALLTFFDGSETQLGGESQVQIEQVTANPAPQIAFLQTAGVTVNHVVPMPEQGSFRTDTPPATGLVRGTSYVVIVGPAGTCGPRGDQPCVASIILLTDRNGHVGRVDVRAHDSTAAPVQLSSPGAAAAASNLAATAANIDSAALANLEAVAHVRGDQHASLKTEHDARGIAATLESLVSNETVSALPPTQTPQPPNPPTLAAVQTDTHRDNSGRGSGADHPRPSDPVAPTKPVTSPPPPTGKRSTSSEPSTSSHAGKSDASTP